MRVKNSPPKRRTAVQSSSHLHSSRKAFFVTTAVY